MAYADCIDVAISGGVATVTFSRPPVNAIDGDAADALKDAFTTLGGSREVRAIVFAAAGDRAFIAGADLKARLGEEKDAPVDPIYGLDQGRRIRESFWAIYDCAVPVVGAINGPAIGAGLVYAAVCDLLVASTRASFSTTEINVGLLGAGSFLHRMVGPYKTRMLFYTGMFASAEEMHRLGAVERVVAPEDLLDAAGEFAAIIASKSPIAMRMAKESLNRVEYLPLKDAYRTEQDYTNRLRTFEDSREAMRAFVEKRDPHWRWR